MIKIIAIIVQHQNGKFMCFGEVPGVKHSVTGYWHSTPEQAKEGLRLAAQDCFAESKEFDLYVSEIRYWKGLLKPETARAVTPIINPTEVDLINNFISIAKTLRARGIEVYPASIEALKSLDKNEDVAWLIEQAEQAKANSMWQD